MTPEELIAEVCVPLDVLVAMDEAANPSMQERLTALEMFLNSEYQSNLAEVVELINNPDAALPFTGVSDWRAAYIEATKRTVRQLHEARFYLAAYGARQKLIDALDT